MAAHERGRSQRSIDELTAALGTGQVFHVYKFVFFAGEIKTSFSCTVPYRLAGIL
jgi:hypothetical protein